VRLAKALDANNVEVWIPMRTVTRTYKKRSPVRLQVSVLPGLVFVQEDSMSRAEELIKRRLVDKATTLVINSRVATATLEELRTMDEQVRASYAVQVTQAGEVLFPVGHIVTVKDGPFAGATGAVTALYGQGRVGIRTDFVPILTIDACNLASGMLPV
jgi:transcription antitermination factor NusG